MASPIGWNCAMSRGNRTLIERQPASVCQAQPVGLPNTLCDTLSLIPEDLRCLCLQSSKTHQTSMQQTRWNPGKLAQENTDEHHELAENSRRHNTVTKFCAPNSRSLTQGDSCLQVDTSSSVPSCIQVCNVPTRAYLRHVAVHLIHIAEAQLFQHALVIPQYTHNRN